MIKFLIKRSDQDFGDASANTNATAKIIDTIANANKATINEAKANAANALEAETRTNLYAR